MSKQRKIAIVATFVIVLIIAGVGIYWYSGGFRPQSQPAADGSAVIGWSREEVTADFKNNELKIRGDAVPPQEIKDRYGAAIAKAKQAISDNKPTIKGDKDVSGDYITVASSYAILGDYGESENWYKKTIEKFPDNYLAHMNLGDLYILMGQSREAAGKFYDTHKLYPKDSVIYTKLADLYYAYAFVNKERADAIYELGVKNAVYPKIVLNSYIYYLEKLRPNPAKLEEMQREYEKITGSRLEQRKENIQTQVEIE